MPRGKILLESESKMRQRFEHTQHEVATIRTSKATPALLDTIKVEAYDTISSLNQVAMVNAPEPRLLVIQPYDRTLLPNIVKAIQTGDLGLNPTDDGNVIRVPVPRDLALSGAVIHAQVHWIAYHHWDFLSTMGN